MKYRKKPVVIEAVQWDGNSSTANVFIGEAFGTDWWFLSGTNRIVIPTLEGNHIGDVGDFIIKGVAGEFYPCKPDIFAKTYEDAETTNEPAIINAFLDLCAPSLDPESIQNVALAVGWLCRNRHISESLIHPWGVDMDHESFERENGQFGVGA